MFIIAKNLETKCSTVQEKINYGIFILREYQAMVKMSELVIHFSMDESHNAEWEKQVRKHGMTPFKVFKWPKTILLLFRNRYTCGKHIKKCMGMTIITFRRVVINL